MYKLFTFILLCLFNNIFGQELLINGRLIDKESHKSLAYANIGINNTNYGTISDSNGLFVLKISDKFSRNTAIKFSFIGYNSIEIPLSTLELKNNLIEMTPSVNILPIVNIGFKKLLRNIVGRNTKGLGLMHSNFYSYYEKEQNDRLSKEMGMRFKIKNDCKIEELNFNITSNDYKSVKFRINIYSIKNNLPDSLIINNDIIFTVENQFLGWYKLDLSPYNIFIDKENKNIAVTIQWVESVKINEKSKYFAISTSVSPFENFLYREKGFDKWITNKSSLSFFISTLSEL